MTFWLYYVKLLPSALWCFLAEAPVSRILKLLTSVHRMAWNVAVLHYDISRSESQMELDAVMWRAKKWTREQNERLK